MDETIGTGYFGETVPDAEIVEMGWYRIYPEEPPLTGEEELTPEKAYILSSALETDETGRFGC